MLCVTHMRCASQVCHGVSRCAKGGSCSSSSLEKKSMNSINGISYYFNKCVDAIKHITDDNLFFLEDSTQVHCVCNTIQLSEKCDFHVSPL